MSVFCNTENLRVDIFKFLQKAQRGINVQRLTCSKKSFKVSLVHSNSHQPQILNLFIQLVCHNDNNVSFSLKDLMSWFSRSVGMLRGIYNNYKFK